MRTSEMTRIERPSIVYIREFKTQVVLNSHYGNESFK